MIPIGAIGYAATGVLYALLIGLLLTAWRGQRVGVFLIAASCASAIWGFVLAASSGYGSFDPLTVALVEVARATAWIAFLVSLVRQLGVSATLRYSSVAACAVVAAGLVLVWTRSAPGAAQNGNVAAILIYGGLVIALFGLVLIEQLYRNSSITAKWSLKPLVLGVGGLFAFDLFLYSQGVLLNSIDPTTWLARGAVNLLFVPMIAIATRRNADWELRIFVSRQVVFYTTTLVAAGLYLLLMSFGGYLIVRYGGSWGGLAQIVFLAGAVIVLFTLLFSNTLRARLKVFLNKHFFHNKYDYREEWLRLVDTLGKFEGRARPDVAIKAIAQVINSPAGAMWIRDESDAVFRFAASYDTRDTFPDLREDDAIVQFIADSGWLVDFAEYRRAPERYDSATLPEWLENRNAAWLLVPLVSTGELLGLILLYAAPGPPNLNYEDRDLLKTVGNHIAVHLAQARADSQLAEAKQFEAYNRLTAFLMHDLNNLIAQQSLIVSNAEKHKHNPEFVDDAIRTIAGSVDRMKRVMQTLKSGSSAQKTKPTNLKYIVSRAVDRCAVNQPVPSLNVNGVDASLSVNAEEFSMVLVHLIRNAQDACKNGGVVAVSLHQDEGSATIIIEDSGEGMSDEFVRDRMFRPFDSTKGNQGMGIGAYQAREFAKRLGGNLTVSSKPGEGTQIRMMVPIA